MTREEQLRYNYEQSLKKLHQEQADCNHDWGGVTYDPRIENVPRYESRFQGSDCMPELVGFTPVKHDRWSRTCKKCGKVEYTEKQVATHYVPDFSNQS